MQKELIFAVEEIEKVISSKYNGIPLKDIVEKRIQEFKELGANGKTRFDFRPFLDIDLETGLFGELCFCFLTANSSAELGIKIQKFVGDEGFMKKSFEELSQIFKNMGHRYPEIRAHYIFLARNFDINSVLKEKDGKKAREKVIKLKGLGMKESSHFLRNIGFDDVAIVDRHIYRFLVRHKLVPQRESISPSLYLICEGVLTKISEILKIPLSALDLFIFFKQSGKVLK
jgi:N-glycosylase/DNA lyase